MWMACLQVSNELVTKGTADNGGQEN
jgi:hypothetical protein